MIDCVRSMSISNKGKQGFMHKIILSAVIRNMKFNNFKNSNSWYPHWYNGSFIVYLIARNK